MTHLEYRSTYEADPTGVHLLNKHIAINCCLLQVTRKLVSESAEDGTTFLEMIRPILLRGLGHCVGNWDRKSLHWAQHFAVLEWRFFFDLGWVRVGWVNRHLLPNAVWVTGQFQAHQVLRKHFNFNVKSNSLESG